MTIEDKKEEEIKESIQNTLGEEGMRFAKNSHYIDIIVRKDGKDYRYQGDWIKKLF